MFAVLDGYEVSFQESLQAAERLKPGSEIGALGGFHVVCKQEKPNDNEPSGFPWDDWTGLSQLLDIFTAT